MNWTTGGKLPCLFIVFCIFFALWFGLAFLFVLVVSILQIWFSLLRLLLLFLPRQVMFVLFCCEKVTCGVHLSLIIFSLMTLTWVRFIIFSVDSLIVTCYFFSTSDFFLFFRNFLLALIIKLPVWCIILIFYSNFNVSIYHWIKIWMIKAQKIFPQTTSHSFPFPLKKTRAAG